MPGYETPSLFDQDGHVDHTGASDSSAAPEVEIPPVPSIAERTGFGTEEAESPSVHDEVVGARPTAFVERSPEGRRTMKLLEDRRAGGHPNQLDQVAKIRQQIAELPEEPKKPIPPLPKGFDPTVFDVDHPEWPIPNRPSR